PSNPPPKRPGRAVVCPTVPGLPGCVSVRCIGVAAFGAVCVAGRAEKGRVPRLPQEKPPPARACASAVTSTTAAATAAKVIKKRWRIILVSPDSRAQEDMYGSGDL